MLTVKELEGLQPKKSPYYVWDKSRERGTGRLGVQVMPSGSINFKFRYFKDSKAQFISLGKSPSMTLAQARELCKKYSDFLSQGLDPKSELEKQERKKAQEERENKELGTFEQLINFHKESKKERGNRSYQDEYEKIVANVFPYIDIHRKAKDFESEDFLDALAIPIDQGYEAKSNKLRS
ncbi:integrase, partial [Vibrio parahaemolyticus]